MEQFLDYIKNTSPLSQKSEENFRKILNLKEYPAKHKLCEIGKNPDKIYFLKSGIIRVFMISPKGNQYNKSIYSKGNFISSLTALRTNTPSLYTIECLTTCVVIEFSYIKFMKLVKKTNDICILYRENIENTYVLYTNRNLEFLTLDATQRYLNLQKRIPNIDNLISQKQIASHLAITTIQLSRIRRKLLIL